MEYTCIKELSLPEVGEDGFETGNQVYIDEGTVWELQDNKFSIIGGDVRLESENLSWIEISNEELKEYFK